MTEALKYDMQQRNNIEFERQRHIANWLIESSPHMPKIAFQKLQLKANNKKASGAQSLPTQQQAVVVAAAAAAVQQQQGTPNPIFFLNKIPLTAGNLPATNSQVFTSQTNLPLQILSTSRDGQKTKLRRFNSHDTSSNMFSVADFENARLARRNEMEMRQRQQRHKLNSLSSGGDCSTGDSKGSKYSCESVSDPLPADLFLERFSLPRVVRLSYSTSNYQSGNETLQSSSSNESNTIIENKTKLNSSLHQPNGELFLLYRYLKDNKVYHAVNTKSTANRRKGLKIPQDFSGYFSLVNEKGAATATLYTTMVQLVRERVYKFVSIENLTAYTETYSTDNLSTKTHYVKGTAKAGQIFRLLAVFQDGATSDVSSSQKDAFIESTNGREKDRGRYAQLLSENRQIIYVSLATKGKFYEIEHHVPHILQKSASLGSRSQLKTLNSDCVHKISNIITADTELPIQLKFICCPQKAQNVVPENVVITKITTETSVIACPIIDEAEDRTPLHLRKIHTTPNMRLIKCFLGFENEQRMFSNQNVQNILKFCQYNCDNFVRLIDFEYLPRDINISIKLSASGSGAGGTITEKSMGGHQKERKLLSLPKFLRHDKSGSAHEKEDSIIFLSKNELENLETQQLQKQQLCQSMSSAATSECGDSQVASDKMRVFQANKQKKWFKNLRSSGKTNSFNGLDNDGHGKERYRDMSKLIQERFGDIEAAAMRLTSTENGTNSDFGGGSSGSNNPNGQGSDEHRQKSVSLQEIDVKSHTGKPDLVVNIDMDANRHNYNSLDLQDPLEPLDANSSLPYLSNNGNQSFISDKLFSEFHVKTKQYSKSSSHLHQLLNFAIPQRNEGAKKKAHQSPVRPQCPPLTLYAHNMDHLDIDGIDLNGGNHRETAEDMSMFDDLPYSSVRDSILLPDAEHEHKDQTHAVDVNAELNKTPPENIYAEICGSDGFNFHTNGAVTAHTSHTQQTQRFNGDSVKISIRSAASDTDRRHRKTDDAHYDIYHVVD